MMFIAGSWLWWGWSCVNKFWRENNLDKKVEIIGSYVRNPCGDGQTSTPQTAGPSPALLSHLHIQINDDGTFPL